MAIEQLDGKRLKDMMSKGADNLAHKAKTIDALNVFPVPDGDTGTNMNLTIKSGIGELEKESTNEAANVADAFARGLLMGARGNSGVILSQLFRGFSRSLAGKKVIFPQDFAKALEGGVNTAFKAVIKPVEGTILTVAKDAANRALRVARDEPDITVVMRAVAQEAKTSLDHTPELLPVLKEAGVIDSGGQGLVTIYEGFLSALTGETVPETSQRDEGKLDQQIEKLHNTSAQSFMKTEEIQYGYCTEFTIQLSNDSFDEAAFRVEFSKHGDSLLVAADDDVIKVHIHTEKPGDMLTYGQQFGALYHIKIENMRSQHENIVKRDQPSETGSAQQGPQPFGFVTVATGAGMDRLFRNLGANVVIEGGQTMNPSTQDLVSAIQETNTTCIFVLPNNGNIIMTAQQAQKVVDADVRVIPTKSVPQGIAALIAFNPDADADTNEKQMVEASKHVKSGQVTFAVRDTQKDELDIKEGDYIGIADDELVVCDTDQKEAANKLLKYMLGDDDDIVTIIYGERASEEEAGALASFVEEEYPDMEVEVHEGGQPVYSYILSVE